MKRLTRTLLAALAAGLTLTVAAPSWAAVDCTTLPNPVYVTGSSAVKPVIAELAKVLVAGNPALTIVYRGQGSCTGVDAILSDTLVTGTGTAVSYWDGSAEQHCDLPVAGVAADIGLSDVFATTCFPGTVLPNTIADFPGPVQTMTFVAPKASTQDVVSAEAAYFIYGFGADSGVAPWTDVSRIFQRNASSGTEQMIATAIKVPATMWQGTPTISSDDIKTKVATATPQQADGTIGILSADVADASRAILKILAYAHYDQTCGYWPDTDATSFDKRNVRDGHYAIWGPLHILTHVSIATGDPVNLRAKDVIEYLTGVKQAPLGLDLIQFEQQTHVIPQCAMHVQRTEEIGPLASFMPTRSCSCYYDKLATGSTSCKACTTKADCTAEAPACNFGYCEVQ